ncbi:MAG: hypothetical protein HY203_10790 [Nitrospirae bacterium]|nr:hypothetical protein [Nitrospirota bacterium]
MGKVVRYVRRLFSLVSIGVYTAAVFMAGMLVGQLYALYVLVYTGAVFMIGVYIGEKLEERFSTQAAAAAVSGSESDLTEVSESDELTLKR